MYNMYHAAEDTDTRLYCSNVLANIYDVAPTFTAPAPSFIASYRAMENKQDREVVVLRANIAVSIALSPFVASCGDADLLGKIGEDVAIFLEVMQRTTGMVEMGMFTNVQEAMARACKRAQECRQ